MNYFEIEKQASKDYQQISALNNYVNGIKGRIIFKILIKNNQESILNTNIKSIEFIKNSNSLSNLTIWEISSDKSYKMIKGNYNSTINYFFDSTKENHLIEINLKNSGKFNFNNFRISYSTVERDDPIYIHIFKSLYKCIWNFLIYYLLIPLCFNALILCCGVNIKKKMLDDKKLIIFIEICEYLCICLIVKYFSKEYELSIFLFYTILLRYAALTYVVSSGYQHVLNINLFFY